MRRKTTKENPHKKDAGFDKKNRRRVIITRTDKRVHMKNIQERICDYVMKAKAGERISIRGIKIKLRMENWGSKSSMTLNDLCKEGVLVADGVSKRNGGINRWYIRQDVKYYGDVPIHITKTEPAPQPGNDNDHHHAFIFGGNPERVAVELHKRREFV